MCIRTATMEINWQLIIIVLFSVYFIVKIFKNHAKLNFYSLFYSLLLLIIWGVYGDLIYN